MKASKLAAAALIATGVTLAGCGGGGSGGHTLTFHSTGPGWACRTAWHAAIDITVQDGNASVIGSASNVHGTPTSVPNGVTQDDACAYDATIKVPDTSQYIVSWKGHGSADTSQESSTGYLSRDALAAKGWKVP